jgi:hypothetical protein
MLDATARGLLDKIIDEAKGAIPVALATIGETSNKEWHTSELASYMLGMIKGFIIGKFFGVFSMLYQRYPDAQEMKEMKEVMNSRDAELRKTMDDQHWMSDVY